MALPLRFLVYAVSLPVLALAPGMTRAAERARSVAIAVDASPERASRHGIEKLGDALRAAGWTTQVTGDADRLTDNLMILAGTSKANRPAARALRVASAGLPTAAEGAGFSPRRIRISSTRLRSRP